MAPNFDRFIHFGNIADPKTRAQIATAVFEKLHSNETINIEVANAGDSKNFILAVDKILHHSTLNEMCNDNKELSGKISADILDFITKTQKQISKTKNPFVGEVEMYVKFQNISKNDFAKEWESAKSYLSKNYNKQNIDLDFYEKEFANNLNKKSNDENKLSFNSVKEHLSDKWRELLGKKQLDWELSIIDEQRKKFCEELYAQIEQLKKLQEALKPFTNELGRLWDMSKGSWQQVNFDLLKKYADLLQRDESLQNLAEMLGRMHVAETEYEEERFTDIQLKTVWKTEQATKSDMIGVCESDDLSSVLPSEIALLANPLTEMIFYKKFVEKKLQTFEYVGRTQEIIEEQLQNKRQKAKEDKKGPFIICVDTSGSMHGAPETVAKTLCFAILKIAIRDNRKCYLISFSTEIQTLNLADLKNSLEKIIQFLAMSFHGGTDASPAMYEALRMLETPEYKQADVIVVSDFVMPAFDEATQQQIKKAKENKTKFHSLIIGASRNNQTIKDFDNNWTYNVNNPGRMINLVADIGKI